MTGLYRRFGKRAIDLVAGVTALLLLGPALLVIAAAIKTTSRGSVFYIQERIGQHGRPFPFIKFRTMVVGAEHLGAGVLCVKDDPRITPVGRFLRRFSIDELPQLFNVLRGEMSLIGPRPGLAYQARQYTAEQRRRLTILPGLTGWAQINGRNSITWDERICRDLEYIDRLSFTLDLRIVLRTFSAVLKKDSLIAQKDHFKERAARVGEQH